MSVSRLVALLLALLLGSFVGQTALAAGGTPRLVVVIVVDGLPQEQVLKYRDQYGEGGFKLLLQKGAWFADAHQAHAVTVTAAGHASILTGAYPYRHGIIDNNWIDRKTLARVYCAEDAAHTYIGEKTDEHDGTSPANLRASTLGDELRYSNGWKSKVVAVSGKDRGAILLAGKTGTAYMYMEDTGRFASSTYYMNAYPQWRERYYAGRPQDRWFSESWTLLLPESAYARSIPDRQPWFGNYRGLGAAFPFQLGRGSDHPGEPYYARLILTPFGDEYTLDFARAAIEGERLGRNPDGVPDLLAVSLSTHDHVNHGFGPESRQSHDHMLRLDRTLAAFFAYLRKWMRMDDVLLVLTADHGFMNAPEYAVQHRLASGRIDPRKLLADLNAHLEARFGQGTYALRFSFPTILLDYALIDRRSLRRNEVESVAAQYLRDSPGIAAVYTRTQLEGGALPEGRIETLVRRAWHRRLSGDLFLVPRPYWIFGTVPATHGSPYTYDTHVPLMFLGERWIKPGKYPQYAEAVDLAPTLAFLLETRLTPASEGRVLGAILRSPAPAAATAPE